MLPAVSTPAIRPRAISAALAAFLALTPLTLAPPAAAAQTTPAGSAVKPAASIPPPTRGRDPWVFRCIFEDRSRMVLLAPAQDLWIAFNPATCAIQKVWRGGILLRGKVWDFSQDNSAATGPALLEAPSDLLPTHAASPASSIPEGWSAGRVSASDKGFAFDGDGATLTSPPFDTTGWSSLFLSFDELSKRGPVRVELSADNGQTWTAQWFNSCLHVESNDQWQWNFKSLVVRSPTTRVRFVQEKADFRKHVRRPRIFGDRPAWSASDAAGPVTVEPRFKGYELIRQTEGVVLLSDLLLPDGKIAKVRHQIDATPAGPGVKVLETLDISDLPPGVTLFLRQPQCKGSPAGKPAPSDPLTFTGGAPISFTLTTEAQP